MPSSDTWFEKGHKGGPGRPQGGRNRLSERFLEDLADIWSRRGMQALEVVATQKPVELFSNILRDYTDEDSLILDPFLGSGTTAVACQNLNRRFIGIEKEEKYCQIARDRLKQQTLI